MDKKVEEILKELNKLLNIIIENNNILGFVAEQMSPPKSKDEALIANSPEEMVEEIFKNNA